VQIRRIRACLLQRQRVQHRPVEQGHAGVCAPLLLPLVEALEAVEAQRRVRALWQREEACRAHTSLSFNRPRWGEDEPHTAVLTPHSSVNPTQQCWHSPSSAAENAMASPRS
jgi:hypothetical protein